MFDYFLLFIGAFVASAISGAAGFGGALLLLPLLTRTVGAELAVPLPTERKVDGLRDVAVQIQGVWVRPGDWLYADEDGIVVADRALA